MCWLIAAEHKLVACSEKVLSPVPSARTSSCFHPGFTCMRTFPLESCQEAIGPETWNSRRWLWSDGNLCIPMSILMWGSYVQQNSWNCALNVDFMLFCFYSGSSKRINLISLAQCSKPLLEEGDSCIIHL